MLKIIHLQTKHLLPQVIQNQMIKNQEQEQRAFRPISSTRTLRPTPNRRVQFNGGGFDEETEEHLKKLNSSNAGDKQLINCSTNLFNSIPLVIIFLLNSFGKKLVPDILL